VPPLEQAYGSAVSALPALLAQRRAWPLDLLYPASLAPYEPWRAYRYGHVRCRPLLVGAARSWYNRGGAMEGIPLYIKTEVT
jgi:hypothetical protein